MLLASQKRITATAVSVLVPRPCRPGRLRWCRLRRAVNARGHFPTGQATLKCLYLALTSLDPAGRGRQRWTNRWKAALNALEIPSTATSVAGQPGRK